MDHELTVAKTAAPEDLEPGQFVAALFTLTEHLTMAEVCGVDNPWQRRGVVRTRWLPREDVGVPFRIAEVCIPFVLLERPDGRYVTLDIRRVQLARVSERYGRKAFKRLKPRIAE
jgi:hypothetical protein